MNLHNRQIASIPILLFSVFVFLFDALALVVPSGYNYGALLLLLPALAFLFVRPYPLLQREDVYLMLALLAYFLVSLASNLFHQLPAHSYDNPARFLLAIPVLLLCIRFPIKTDFFWLGLSAGAIGAAAIALWDLMAQGEWRASGHTNAIQFGDIAMLFSCLLLPALVWAKKISRIHWLVIVLGIASGLIASLLSGARGGWLAFPISLLWLYVACGFYKQQKKTVAIAAIFLGTLIAVYQFPQQGLLQSRIHDGLQDLQQYQLTHDTSTSIGSRLHMWQRSVEMIARHPLQGWGTQERVVQYLDNNGIHDPILAEFNHVHNDMLDAFVKRGLFGGLALFALYGIPLCLFYRQWRRASAEQKILPAAGVTLIVCVATFGLTQTFFSHISGCMVYSFLLVILWAQVRTQNITYKQNIDVHNYPLNSLCKGN